MKTIDIQKALKALGFDPGPIDGVPGRATAAGVRKFQASKGLLADGIVGPLTAKALAAALPGAVTVTDASDDLPPWFVLAGSKKGLLETDPVTKAFLKSDGETLGDPAKLPWCGDFVETCIGLTLPNEITPANPYYALNWSTFGIPTTEIIGAILTFVRDGGGHVGFYVGEDANNYRVRGGNQSNKISDTWVAKSRLHAIRYPKTFPRPEPRKVLLASNGEPISKNEA